MIISLILSLIKSMINLSLISKIIIDFPKLSLIFILNYHWFSKIIIDLLNIKLDSCFCSVKTVLTLSFQNFEWETIETGFEKIDSRLSIWRSQLTRSLIVKERLYLHNPTQRFYTNPITQFLTQKFMATVCHPRDRISKC